LQSDESDEIMPIIEFRLRRYFSLSSVYSEIYDENATHTHAIIHHGSSSIFNAYVSAFS